MEQSTVPPINRFQFNGREETMPTTRASSSLKKESIRNADKPSSNPKKRGEPEASTSGVQSAPTAVKHPREKEQQPPEKRQARFIARPSFAVSERIERAFQHRLYFIEKKTVGSACEFFVLGATGNVYSVRLDLRPSCTCPDFLRGNTCKHILFVMLRVLKLPRHDPRVWQKALLKSELDHLLHTSSVNEAVLASYRVRSRFHEITGSSPQHEDEKAVQRDLEGDCPVCYDKLSGGKEAVVFCRVCGNNVHADCFIKWSKSKRPGTVTCIYCRAPWEDKNKDGKKYDEGYVNLAAYSDWHSPEETSLEALYPHTSIWIRHR